MNYPLDPLVGWIMYIYSDAQQAYAKYEDVMCVALGRDHKDASARVFACTPRHHSLSQCLSAVAYMSTITPSIPK